MERNEYLFLLANYENVLRNTDDPQMMHLLGMVEPMRGMADHVHGSRKHRDQLNRWLGFMQGVLWSRRKYTLKQLMAHNWDKVAPDDKEF